MSKGKHVNHVNECCLMKNVYTSVDSISMKHLPTTIETQNRKTKSIFSHTRYKWSNSSFSSFLTQILVWHVSLINLWRTDNHSPYFKKCAKQISSKFSWMNQSDLFFTYEFTLNHLHQHTRMLIDHIIDIKRNSNLCIGTSIFTCLRRHILIYLFQIAMPTESKRFALQTKPIEAILFFFLRRIIQLDCKIFSSRSY